MKKLFSILFIVFFVLSSTISQQTYSLSKFASATTATASTTSLTEYEAFLDSINPQIAMSTNDYRVTAGDIYTLAFLVGTEPVEYIIPVDTTYKIRVANLTIIDASNKTFSELKNQVEALIQKNYPMSGVQFVLTSPAIFKVNIIGEINMTGEIQLWALTRLSNVVDSYLTDYSSLRDIVITSSNGTKKTYDLFKALRFGDLNQNPYLRPDDIITINRANKKVKIYGEVERPDTYQLLEKENLYELINTYASGLTNNADTSRIEIIKVNSVQDKRGEKNYISMEEVEENYSLFDNDEIYIPSLSDSNLKIIVEGSILSVTESTTTVNGNKTTKIVPASSVSTSSVQATNKIVISFKKGTTYNSIIHEYAAMFSTVSDIENAYILRNNTIIPLQIKDILYNDKYTETLTLENMDNLIIPAKQYFVTVVGAVNSPGRYPFIPNRTYDYYVGLAGGFDTDNNLFNTVKITDIKGTKYTKKDIIKPEMTIKAVNNSAKYIIGEFSTYIVTLLTIISTCLSLYAIFKG